MSYLEAAQTPVVADDLNLLFDYLTSTAIELKKNIQSFTSPITSKFSKDIQDLQKQYNVQMQRKRILGKKGYEHILTPPTEVIPEQFKKDYYAKKEKILAERDELLKPFKTLQDELPYLSKSGRIERGWEKLPANLYISYKGKEKKPATALEIQNSKTIITSVKQRFEKMQRGILEKLLELQKGGGK